MLMNYEFLIEGTLPGLNDYIAALDSNIYVGNNLKQQAQNKVICSVRKCLSKLTLDKPINLHYRYYEPNRKRDKDNIAGFAHKVVQDALVSCGVIPNDGWRYINRFSDDFFVDKEHPRIGVTIEEVNT